MGTGVAAIFGPLNRFTSEHVQSICDTKEIPHIYGRWEPSQPRGKGINLFPHADTLAMVSEIREVILCLSLSLRFEKLLSISFSIVSIDRVYGFK